MSYRKNFKIKFEELPKLKKIYHHIYNQNYRYDII